MLGCIQDFGTSKAYVLETVIKTDADDDDDDDDDDGDDDGGDDDHDDGGDGGGDDDDHHHDQYLDTLAGYCDAKVVPLSSSHSIKAVNI